MWILIVVFTAGYNGHPRVAFQEFSSTVTCEHAAAIVKESWRDDKSRLRTVQCVKK